MKRAKAYIVSTPLFQFYKLTHNINDVDTIGDLLYGIRTDQEHEVNIPALNCIPRKLYH